MRFSWTSSCAPIKLELGPVLSRFVVCSRRQPASKHAKTQIHSLNFDLPQPLSITQAGHGGSFCVAGTMLPSVPAELLSAGTWLFAWCRKPLSKCHSHLLSYSRTFIIRLTRPQKSGPAYTSDPAPPSPALEEASATPTAKSQNPKPLKEFCWTPTGDRSHISSS